MVHGRDTRFGDDREACEEEHGAARWRSKLDDEVEEHALSLSLSLSLTHTHTLGSPTASQDVSALFARSTLNFFFDLSVFIKE